MANNENASQEEDSLAGVLEEESHTDLLKKSKKAADGRVCQPDRDYRHHDIAGEDTSSPNYRTINSVLEAKARGRKVSLQDTMKFELLRFYTLRNFPKVDKPFITKIAAAGFYYAGFKDEVICYCCTTRKRNWTAECNPMTVHRQLAPHCSFLNRNTEVNFPVPHEMNSHDPDKFANLQELLETPPPENGDNAQLLKRYKTEKLAWRKKQLMEENEQLRKQILCKLCKKQEVCVAFLPCGHLVTCANCAFDFRIRCRFCFICGGEVMGTIKIKRF